MPRMMSVKASERRVSDGIAGGGLVLICLRRVGIAVDMVDDQQAVNGEEGSAQGQISLRESPPIHSPTMAEDMEVSTETVNKNKRYRKPKPWDTDDIDHVRSLCPLTSSRIH
jgi:hypothetical protein